MDEVVRVVLVAYVEQEVVADVGFGWVVWLGQGGLHPVAALLQVWVYLRVVIGQEEIAKGTLVWFHFVDHIFSEYLF